MTPDADIEITPKLVRRLLESQFPDVATLPIQILDSGWDNVMARLGDKLAVRLPRRQAAEPLILKEQKWLAKLAPLLPVSVPNPIWTGHPEPFYPFHWSVLEWLPGQAADLSWPDAGEAEVLAVFLKALHAIPLPPRPPENAQRDRPLTAKQSDIEKRMLSLDRKTNWVTDAVKRAWQNALEVENDLPKCWIAGDIHARNVLVENGKITAFIDWGDMCAGDPATDLSSIWALMDDQKARRRVQNIYGMSDATLARAKGWAVFYGVILADTGLKDTPRHAAMGKAILERIHEDSFIADHTA